MKKLNIPLVVFLAVGFLVTVIGVHLLHGYQVSRSAEKLLDRAQAAAAKGEANEQIRLLRRYLRHRPNDLENMKVLLESTRQQLFSSEDTSWRDIGNLLGSLEKAIRDNPEDVDLRRQGYVLSAMVGRFGDALDHLEQLKAMGQITGEDRVMLARCFWQKGDAQQAMNELSELIGFNLESRTFDDSPAAAPDQIDAYTLLAVIYMRDRTGASDLTVPQAIVDKAIERNPDSADAYLRRAGFYQENVTSVEGKESSMRDIDKALELSPDDPVVILAAATTAMMLNDLDRAAKLADEGLAKHPDNADMYAKRAEVARAQGQTAQALELIKQGLEKHQMNGELLYRRGSYEVDLDMLDDARTTLERLANRVDRVRVEILQSRILMASNDFSAASRRLEQLKSAGVSERTLGMINELLSRCYMSLNQPDRLPDVIGSTDTSQGKLILAGALAQQGRLDEAAKMIEDVLQTDRTLSPKLREQASNQLFPILIQLERTKPSSQRNWEKVDKLADLLIRGMNLQDASLAQFEIEVLVQKDLLSEARDKAEQAVGRFPTTARLRLLLAQLTPDHEQGLRILQQLEQAAGDSAVLRVTMADKIEMINGPDMAAQLKELESHDFTKPEDLTVLYQGLAGVYRRAGMHQDALRLMRQLLPLHPKNLGIRIVSFDVAFEANDADAMKEMLGEIEKVTNTESAEWQVADARRRLWMHEHGNAENVQLEDILSLLQRAEKTRPDFPPIYMVRAEVQLLRDEPDPAIESIKKALEKRPGEVTYLRRLVDVLVSLNRVSEAQPYLAQLPEQNKRAQDMFAEVNLLLLAQQPQKAVELAEKIISPTSGDPAMLMKLVEVYTAANAMDRALPALKRAIQLDPSEPRPWFLYVRALVAQDKTDEAKAAIESMKSRVAPESLPLALGQCYATVGELALAEQAYDEGLQKAPNNTVMLRNQALLFIATQQSDKLRACLGRLMAVDNPDDVQTQGDIAWARRTLAQQLGSTGTYQDFMAALKVLQGDADDSSHLTGEDLSLWLRLCASRSEVASRRKAIDRLNQIRNERALNSVENAVMAYIYHAEGRWTEAKQQMIDLLAKNPTNVGFITTYIDWLLERKEFSDATAWIRKLNPESFEAMRYTSILLTQQGKAAEAAQQIRSLVPNRIDEVTAAKVMEELGKYDNRFYELTRRHWESMVKKNPQTIHAYISYLARMPEAKGLELALKLSEAQLQQAVKDGRPDLAGYYMDLGIKALRANRKALPADSPYFERVLSWFDLARQANVNELTLAWNQVDYFDARRDYDRLETLYTELLKRTDLNPLQQAVVRNNLAYIYAISNKGHDALAVIGDAISQIGPQSDFLDTRGLAHLASGDVERAVEDLRSAVAGGQGNAPTYFHLALAEHHSGNVAEAASALRTANEMGLNEADLSAPEVKLYRKLMLDLAPHLKENELSQARSPN